MRTALLAVPALSLLALSAARAETIYVSEPYVLDRTEYEMVDAADAFLLARITGASGEDVEFKIEEVLKGPKTLRTLSVTGCLAPPGEESGSFPRCDYRKESSYAFFLTREEDGWNPSDFLFNFEVKPGDESWFGALRLFAGISALDDDEREEQALRELRDAALAEPDRYPAKLARMIDQHFGRPSLGKPFAELLDLYEEAWNDRERLEVLRTLRKGEHAETPGFFRGLLLGGEPLWLLEPVLEWMGENPDEAPPLKDLARVWLAHPSEDRSLLLERMLGLAGPGDVPLLWSLLSSADLDERKAIVLWALDEAEPGRLSLPPDEPLRKDLLLVWLEEGRDDLEALLRRDRTRDWRAVPRVENLVEAFEASRRPAERRQILMELARRDRDDLAVIWRLLRSASEGEAEVLLLWASLLDPPRGLLVDDYRGATGEEAEEARNRALWLLFAVANRGEVEPLLSVTGALGEGAAGRLERVVRAFRTCPSARVRSLIAFHLQDELAEAGDPAVLRLLETASLDEARELAPWLAQNPAPEARTLLWSLPIPSLYDDREIAEALAAAGDPEVLDMALELRHRLMTEEDPWAFMVLARSPLPAAEEEALLLLEEEGYLLDQLVWVLGEEESPSPWRERFLAEVAESAPSEATRQNALNYLQRLSGEDAESEPPEP